MFMEATHWSCTVERWWWCECISLTAASATNLLWCERSSTTAICATVRIAEGWENWLQGCPCSDTKVSPEGFLEDVLCLLNALLNMVISSDGPKRENGDRIVCSFGRRDTSILNEYKLYSTQIYSSLSSWFRDEGVVCWKATSVAGTRKMFEQLPLRKHWRMVKRDDLLDSYTSHKNRETMKGNRLTKRWNPKLLIRKMPPT